jgi:hypothetical protein
MTEASQIFALLRSSSAAELAKRFNAVDDGAMPAPLASPRSAAEGPRGQLGGGSGTGPGTGPGPGGSSSPPAVGVGGATLAASGSPLPASAAPVPGGLPQDIGGSLRVAVTRAALSLGHLSPPRADFVRLVHDASVLGLSQMIVAAGTEARAIATLATSSGAGGAEGPLTSGASPDAIDTGAPFSATRLERGTADVRSGLTGGVQAGNQADGLAPRGAGPAGATVDSPARAATPETGFAMTQADPRSAPGSGPSAPVAFAEAVLAMLAADGAGRGTSVASGVIFNAAMIPGWPFPSAFARDGAEAINPKAMLHRLAGAIEAMTPEEAAAYLAKIGGGHVFLRNLRRILKELDMVEKDDVKGLLFAFLETLSSIASGLQTAFRQLAESAVLQEAVAHGEDPEDGDRPGRRRLKL